MEKTLTAQRLVPKMFSMLAHFGPFEVDTENGRLLKHGIAVGLREQPFRVLVALLERPGDVVTRDELRRRLWSHHTFVDFEVGLNSAVSRLRHALDDPADSPQLIETVPKRGYRFIGAVPRQRSLAVMPFLNQTSDPSGELLSDGLADELICALSRIKGLKVAARSVVARYKAPTYDLKQAGREIGVDAVLEGSVRQAGNRIRINVHLVNAQDGFELWAHRFDSDWKDIFAIHDVVASGVAEALRVRLAPTPSENRPHVAEAYTSYLKGHHLTKRHTPANLRRGLEYFQEAIRLDPRYALPYHGAALYYILGALMGTLDPSAALPEADDLIARGLALDADSAMLQNTLGMLRMFQWRWQESERAYRRAIVLDPANAYPHMMYALECTFLGRHDEALREARRALELEPLDPMTNFRLVQSSYYAGHYDEAVRSGRTAIELSRDFPYTHWYVAWSLVALGTQDEAWAMANEARGLGAAQPLSEGHFGYVAGALGHGAEARAVLEDLLGRRERSYCPAVPIAWTYLGLGDAGRSLDWLETALAEREPYLGSVMVFPGYHQVRNRARFRDLVHQMGLVDAGRGSPLHVVASH
jgi:TolB-like protein/tetratricopeptide (TPR) repeat protein